jgi:hypothetical protein
MSTKPKTRYITNQLLDFLTYMPQGDDLELIVLKGHLLLERQLEAIIRCTVPHSKHLPTLSFSEKALLARAMSWTHEKHAMWEFIIVLNTLRNHFSHSLGSGETPKKIRNALEAHRKTVSPNEKKAVSAMKEPDRLRKAVDDAMQFLEKCHEDAFRWRHPRYALRYDSLS